ncbi:hypothetical protein Rsub_07402 [Raphidocelis subcapitata]|uniref:Vacuolar protein sorting-associated protein n=1 Tax=Raphidocelis subcapitata TaxID=307507 RepID=A0A2V0P485_9CHLO|nr:hypothetical protein Rsub_07402 [Raphidocelis subcapitata]|eukprot:GBF94666.1 hypothetical protein Rsub_07402 [Raphidocelis subcapitata]
MRRRPGIAGLQRDAQAREQYRAAGEGVRRATAAALAEQLTLFRTRLEDFASKHRSEIRADPVFRAQFHAMCASIGVDPLASNKGMWAELLGFGDYYYELGVQILEACVASRPLNGGLMELGALRAAVLRRRGAKAEPVSDDDVRRALSKLKSLGGGLDLVTIGAASYVRSVPGELNLDKNAALALAQDKGCVSAAELCSKSGWTAGRAEDCLEGLLREGLALVDDGAPDGVRLWWFPALLGGGGGGGGGGSSGGGAAGGGTPR